jgi:small subunit ribosomal protein S20
MANTRKSTKRALQTVKRQTRNTVVRSATKTALRDALAAIQTKDVAKAKEAYMSAVKALSKAASKGGIPQGRAARKISRLTHFIKKSMPQAISAK